MGENCTKKSSPRAEILAVFRHTISKDQKQKKVLTEFVLVFILHLSKLEKRTKKKDLYRELKSWLVVQNLRIALIKMFVSSKLFV